MQLSRYVKVYYNHAINDEDDTMRSLLCHFQCQPSPFQIDKKTVNGKKSGIRQHSWRRQQQQQQQHQDPNNNSNTTAFKAMQGQGKAFREIPMLNMFLQRLQQHTNLATAAAILGTPANATAVPTPAAAAAVKQASSGHAKSIKHKNGGKKQGNHSFNIVSRKMAAYWITHTFCKYSANRII